jgi:hypothetical protein
MRYWWVNQNQTYHAEVRGNFMWSPKTKIDGARNQSYDNMRRVSPGDIVFSFCDTRIKAVGVATADAQTAPKPDFGNAGLNWAKEGGSCQCTTPPSSIPFVPKITSPSFGRSCPKSIRPCGQAAMVCNRFIWLKFQS